jgi:hypothetical protein
MRQVEANVINPSFTDDQNTFLAVKIKNISIHTNNLSVPSTILHNAVRCQTNMYHYYPGINAMARKVDTPRNHLMSVNDVFILHCDLLMLQL